MKLGSFVTGLALVVVACVVATPGQAVADQLGTSWKLREHASYDIVWTRRGTSNVFDGVWTQKYTREKITAVLTITVNGNAVSAQRRNGSDGSNVNYTGSIDKDGITVRGTAKVLPSGATFPWVATIVGGTGSTSTPVPPSPPPPPPAPAGSLTGAWVHSMDPNFKNHDSKVIVIQDGNQVTMTQAHRYNGRWIVLLCRGVLSGNRWRADCSYQPGGNPFGFTPSWSKTWVLSPDGIHLDAVGDGQESHYSRIP